MSLRGCESAFSLSIRYPIRSDLCLIRFPSAARPEVEKILERSAEALRAILRDGVLKAMTEYNS